MFFKDKVWMLWLSGILFYGLLTLCFQIQLVSSHSTKVAPLLLISFDGFRWDFLNKHKSDTPNFHKMKEKGVYARSGIKCVFETITIPNHWTLVTGLYTESHKVYSNFMYDPVLKEEFYPEWWKKYPIEPHHNDYRFYDAGGEPIWVTNQLQNTHARSGSVMWYGSDQQVKWVRPTFYMAYDMDVPLEERVDKMVQWFSQDNPINLGLIYFDKPDTIVHKTGIDSKQTKEVIKGLDATVGYLFDRLKEKDLLDDINIIMTSDHGFASMLKSKYIMMDDIVSPHLYEKILSTTPVFSVIPKPGMEDQIYKNLKEAADKPESHFQFYKKDDIPERLHYKRNFRVSSFIALAELEYSFIVNQTAKDFKQVAGHGFDNKYQEMQPFFIAMGPSFKVDYSVETFNSVDIYPLMCHLLHLTPAPNNGSLEIVSTLLVEHETTMWTFVTYIITLIVIGSVGGVFLVAACRYHSYLKRNAKDKLFTAGQVKYKIPRQKGPEYVRVLNEKDNDEEEENVDMGVEN